ncbi:MAG: hypothetical protein JO328_00610 [Hyphomicrobiales bacterium]|nr:hypothetical protein [Hyphomicrobiales bacterium]MBV8824852.1 hypothetical protein [Hyphomicrobiales bacterium]
MTDRTIELDRHRGMAAQKATEIRRQIAEVEANRQTLRARQEELEKNLLAAPALNWHEASEKARYLLMIFSATPDAQDPRRQKLIDNVLDDFTRLCRETSEQPHPAKD